MNELEKVKDLIAENSYNEAKKELTKYISEGHENDLEVLKLMGLVNVNLQDYKSATTNFEKAIKISPKDATALFYLANCYDNLNRLSDAESYYIKVLEIR